LTVSGDVLGTVANAEAPGTGALVIAGTQAIDKYAVNPGSQNAAPKQQLPPVAQVPVAGSPPVPDVKGSDAQRSASVLSQRGWSDAEVAQHLQGPPPQISHEQGAHIVHGVLQQAGWPPDARRALLHGPCKFYREYLQPRPATLDPRTQAAMQQYDHDALLRRRLYTETEPAGFVANTYEGTHDAHVGGLGITTELAGKEG
jgi:hypothetical protein